MNSKAISGAISEALSRFAAERETMKPDILPEHPDAQEEYLRLQETRDAIDREIREVEALTGAKAGE